MTYFELVGQLEKMIKAPINESDIALIDSADISLNGMRYDRFISQVNYFMNERLANFYDTIIGKIRNKRMTNDELTLEMSLLKIEIDYLNKFIQIKHIKNENKVIFIDSLIKNNNEMLEKIKACFDDENSQRIIDGYFLKESEANGL